MSERQPVIRKLVIFGTFFMLAGAGMTVRGVLHTASGEPVPGNRYEKESTGPENILFGLIGLGFGGFVAWRGLQGKPWP